MTPKERSLRILEFGALPLVFDGFAGGYEGTSLQWRQRNLNLLKARYLGIQEKMREYLYKGYLRNVPYYEADPREGLDPEVYLRTTPKGSCLFDLMRLAMLGQLIREQRREASAAYYSYFVLPGVGVLEAAREIAECHTPETAAATSCAQGNSGGYAHDAEGPTVGADDEVQQ